MSGRGHRSGLGFGGAVGLGVAAVLVVGAVAVGHAVFHLLTDAAGVVIVFAAVAVCALVAAAAYAAVGLVVARVRLAQLEVAERLVRLEQLAEHGGRVVAEVLEHDAAAPISQVRRPAILGKRAFNLPGRHLEAVPGGDRGGAS